MNDALKIIAIIVGGFLLAGIPWGVVLGRWLKGIDLRQHGSGATGATNSLRTLGWKIALAVFLLDFSKGFIPVLAARLWHLPPWAIGLTAIAVCAGHCWSPYIHFKGGKGMATGGGAAVALFPWLVFMVFVIVIVVALTRYVSLGSILTAMIGPALTVVFALNDLMPAWWSVGVVGIGVIIIFQHRANIDRLLKGTERKFGQKEAVTPSAQA